jgi:N6-adenosine-specific RNA methylase IME4
VSVTLEYHPLANLFPLIEGEEFAALVADIRANGVHDPIDLYQGKILDGRNRHRAAIAAEFELEKRHFRHYHPEIYGDPLAYVISKNLSRRHLDESQRAMVAARLATMRQGERTDLAAAEPSANLPKVDQPTAAKTLSISERALRHARRVQDHGAPELVRAVDRGHLAVSAADQASRLPAETQRKIAAEAEAGRSNVVRKVIKQEQRSARESELADRIIAAPEGKFGVIVEDYEWDHVTWSEAGKDRHAGNHYPVSRDAHTAEEIVERTKDRFACAAEDCVFYMWATIPHLAIALKVLELRGFEYKSHHAWVKDNFITGYWCRGQHEILLIGTKGKVVAPAMGTQESSVLRGPSGEHSEKPEIVMQMIERLFPNIPKLELNSRRSRPGWTVWGLDAQAPIDPCSDGPMTAPPEAQAQCQPESTLEHDAPPGVVEPAPVTVSPPAPGAGSVSSDDVLECPAFLLRQQDRTAPQPAAEAG